MTQNRRIAAWILLVAALTLAGAGQQYFLHRRDYVWDGVVFFAAASVCFLLAWRLAGDARRREVGRSRLAWAEWLRAHAAQVLLVALGVFLSSMATLLSAGRGLDEAMGDVVALWMLGIGAMAAAAVWPAARLWAMAGALPEALHAAPVAVEGHAAPDTTAASAANGEGDVGTEGRSTSRILARMAGLPWLEVAAVAGLTLVALTLRVAALDRIPFTIGGDEAWHGLLARQVLNGQMRNPFNMGYMSMPTGFYWPLSWAMGLVGDGVVGLRLPGALVGTATVPVLYLFVRGLWDRRTAVVAAAFLAGWDYHVHYSRLGANNVWDPLFVLLALWAVLRGLDAKRGSDAQRWLLTGGLVMGFSVYFYTGARLLPLLVGAYAAFVWLQGSVGKLTTPAWRRVGAGLVLLFLAFLVAAGPMLSFAASHPNEWNARINQVGIVQSGWLEREPGLTGKTTAAILAEQFLRAAGAFHVFPDRTVWYGAERPLLGFLPGIAALLGMVWAARHWRERRYFLLLSWFWSVVITGGMLTESPPSSQRLVIAIPAVAVLVAVGLEQTVKLARRLLTFDRRWADAVAATVTVMLVVVSVHYYFVEFTPQRRYGSWNGETATRIGYALQELDGEYQVYLMGAPDLYWSFGTMSFLAPGVSGRDLVEPLTGPPGDMDEAQDALFILLPERAGELVYLEDAYPSGIAQEFRDEQDRLRFVTYAVDFE